MIEFRDVTLAFGDRSVLKGLSFSAANGRVTGFVGPNGSGKTTSFRVLSGLLPADSGEALIDGKPHRDADISRRAMGMFLGGDTIPGYMTGSSYLAYVADLVGAPRSGLADALVAVGLAGNGSKKVGDYSLGMKQRLGLAAALVGRPTNLVLDEPVNGLDVEGVRWVRDRLRAAAAEGCCVLLSSHLLSELELVADDIVILGEGVAKRTGPLSAMLVATDRAIAIVSSDPQALAAHLIAHGATAEVTGGSVHVTGRDVNWLAAVASGSGVQLESIAPVRRRIEDVYTEETGTGPRSVPGTLKEVGGAS